MNMRKLYSILSIACLLFCSSCNNWLDVTPQGQVEAEDLFQTSKGCNSAVGGIYYTLSGSNLFGQALSYGLIDVLAQYWDFAASTDHVYYQAAQYDYNDQTVISVCDNAWGDLYYAIAQCNAFIEYAEPYQENIDNYDLLLGEVYALRAFAHMTLFELFGPVIHTKADLQKDAIAYRTVYNNISQGFDTGETVLENAAEDLTRALAVLENDPIRNGETGRTEDGNTSVIDYQDVLNFRGARMNYFCVLGLLARLEMLRQNPEVAYTYATRVLEECEGIISLVDKANIMTPGTSRICNFSTEMLGSFYVNDLYTAAGNLFGMGGHTVSNTMGIVIDANRYGALQNYVYDRQPDGDAGLDTRFSTWFQASSDYANYDFTKFLEPAERQGMGVAYYPEIPVMRLSEIYYIACEAQIGNDNTLALQYLNTVRDNRNLPLLQVQDVPDDATLLEYLVREMRKDFIGDGRTFLMHKRLFYDIYTARGETIPASDNIFVLPIPDDEYEFAGIEKPGTTTNNQN